ncbi:MAG: DNA gyrase inhibitor YacG [Pirellulaceae bacterium]
MAHCPICRRRFHVDDSTSMPFCSDRCRHVDLGRWLNEQYGLRVEPDEHGENGRPRDEPDD